MAFCPSCGRECSDADRFCDQCGEDLPTRATWARCWHKPTALIAVVAIATLLVIFGRAKERPKVHPTPAAGSDLEEQQEATSRQEESGCLRNVKDLSIAMQMFVVDHDRFPPCERWVAELAPYVRHSDVFRCPADDAGLSCSYAMNVELDGKPSSGVADPANTVVFFETTKPGPSPVGGPGDVVSPPRHPNGNNYAFVDGSARCVEGVPNFSVGESASVSIPGVGLVDRATGRALRGRGR